MEEREEEGVKRWRRGKRRKKKERREEEREGDKLHLPAWRMNRFFLALKERM